MESVLDQKVREYKVCLDRKAELEDQTKANNAEKERLEQEICQIMVDEEKPNTTVDGFTYSLQQKTMYSKKSEEDLAHLQNEEGIVFFDVLREQGIGDIIKETVNAQTLQSTIKAMADDLPEGEELPEDLAKCLNIYEKLSIMKRKANTAALQRAKAAREEQ